MNFHTREDIVLEKLMGRRVCPVCSRNYNLTHIDRDGIFMWALLPKGDPNLCDDCDQISLVVRDGDEENIILECMEI